MIKILLERLKQGRHTIAWPDKPPEMPDRSAAA